MATFGGDRVVPYGVGPGSAYDVGTGEWRHPALLGGGEYTRRRQIAVNFAVRMFLEDASPSGSARGRKLARDTSIVRGTDGNFPALRNGYSMARRFAEAGDIQAAVDGVSLEMVWRTRDGAAPTAPGTYPLEVHVRDGSGKPVGWVPVLQLSSTGIEGNRSIDAVAEVDQSTDSTGDRARWDAATAAGWPVWGMNHSMSRDARFMVSGADGISAAAAAHTADVADAAGVARFDVTITEPSWELAFHAQAPTADVELWAGTGLQGQVTWAGRPQSASAHQEHTPPMRHVRVEKVSTEPSLSVAGTELALLDAAGIEIERGAVGDDGLLGFAPIDLVAHPAPYVVRELQSAPGLTVLDGDIAVPDPVSTDAAAPTVVVVRNAPIIGSLRVRKTFEHADLIDGRDLSGFVFAVSRVGSSDPPVDVVTGPDGRTEAIDVMRGSYLVEETNRPPWATATSGSPIEVAIDPEANPDVEVQYENVVPSASIDTVASDAADGDAYLDAHAPDAAIADRVDLCGLLPGTAYVLRGDVMRRTDGSVEPTGASATVEVAPDATCVSVDMVIDIPGDVLSSVAGSTLVVFQQLTVASSARVVAMHDDPLDADQTIFVPAVATSLRAVTEVAVADEPRAPVAFLLDPGTPLVDHLTYRGLQPGGEYLAEVTLARRQPDGTCADGELVGATPFVADDSGAGFVTVPAGEVPGSGAFAASQRIVRADDPHGSAVVMHDGCDDDEQTIWSIGIDTAVEAPVVTGEGVMRDRITVTGLEVPVPGVAAVSVDGGLFAHGDRPERTDWTCADDNRTASFSLPLPSAADDDDDPNGGDLTVWTPGESHGLGWHSYDVRLTMAFDDGTTWSSAPHGCRTPTESFHAFAPPTSTTNVPTTAPSSLPPTTTIAATTIPLPTAPPPTPPPSTAVTVPPTVAPRPLPTTGGGTTRLTIAVAGLLLAVGAVTLAASRRT